MATNFNLNGVQHANIYGVGVWEVLGTVYEGSKPKKANGTDPRALAPGHYKWQAMDGSESILVKETSGGWYYISIVRDADGEPITGSSYTLRECRLRKEFQFTNGDGERITIPAGTVKIRAYAE